MCTVSINVDEAMMRQINPCLTSRESIGQWLQHQVDLMMKEMAHGRAESRRQALEKDMTPEQLYSVIAEEIDEVYSPEEAYELIMSDIRSIYGIKDAV